MKGPRGRKLSGVATAVLAALAAPLFPQEAVKIDADTIGGLEARSIGPAVMSGRIAALDAVEGDRLIL